ncbi:nitroreductase family deazaflavin-dependent oxidoreductase [Virgisporangium ochraceum]|uniref:nitroreductase family deazaflavin-dependent oxidoreductase n=1 Tax=Virgisporangium ochraceum TaxID=65505 RepID=UPI001941C376|nr:nitroreductase family deazaflavin-dependent oxidoreductase [Virgisporangium ochraceum]
MPVHTFLINRVATLFVGFTGVADVEHVGRRSGRAHHTPVRAYRRGDTVVVAVNFGRRSDWVRNIEAGGGCRMRLGSRLLRLSAPRLVPIGEGVAHLPPVVGFVLRRLVRTRECLCLSVVGATVVGRFASRSTAFADPPGARS